jgi:hypothetical protein
MQIRCLPRLGRKVAIKPIPHLTTFDQWAEACTTEVEKVFLKNGSYDDFVINITKNLNRMEEEKSF